MTTQAYSVHSNKAWCPKLLRRGKARNHLGGQVGPLGICCVKQIYTKTVTWKNCHIVRANQIVRPVITISYKVPFQFKTSIPMQKIKRDSRR